MSQISEPLNSVHKISEFSCGKQMSDNYMVKQANQDFKRKLSACFVINDKSTNLIKGYYTLSNNSISQEFMPFRIQKIMPESYKAIPTTLLGRLVVDHRFQERGVGKLLLMDALKRCYNISKTIGSFAVVVDPMDQIAENYYEKHGFVKLPDSGKMFLPMKTIKTIF